MKTQLLISNIAKTVGNKLLFTNLSFLFETGCYAIIGQNGIGKTVLLEMLAGISLQHNGIIKLSDGTLNTSTAYKMQLAYIPCKPCFFPAVTGREFLNFIAAIKKVNIANCPKLQAAVANFNLTNHLTTKFAHMSLGTQQKLFLATLAIGDNRLIILDEPTNGLDKDAREFLFNLLQELRKNAIVIFTTHDPLLLNALNTTTIRLHTCPTTYFELLR